MKITDEISELFGRCRRLLGAPIVSVELTDDQLCAYLEVAIEDYAEKVQNWIIEQNWSNLYGKNLSNTDLAFALTARTLDMSKDYSYWFSKEAGFQQRGPYEMKKDFFKIERGKQDYIIPAGREINRVLYCNPPTTQAALYANYGGLDMLGFAGGYAGAGLGGAGYGPIGGFYIAQSCDVAYMAADLNYKNRLLRGDLTYKVTAGPDGTHIIHLYSTPGSKINFGGVPGSGAGISLMGCEVWYTYYDSVTDIDECRRLNPDILITPDQIPLSKMDYSLFNEPTKTIVRKLFVAKAKQALGLIRGKFSGKMSIMDAEAQMDYNMLVTQGKEEYDAAMKSLEDRLDRMSPYKVMENQANLSEHLSKILSAKPMRMITV